jgi:hypothetical protein
MCGRVCSLMSSKQMSRLCRPPLRPLPTLVRVAGSDMRQERARRAVALQQEVDRGRRGPGPEHARAAAAGARAAAAACRAPRRA